MNILILTQYFPPETGAPQNRLFDLALRLIDFGYSVTVLTANPNYPQYKIYEGYKNKFFYREDISGINVYRSWIFISSKKSLITRLFNYFSFTVTSFINGLFRIGKTDIIICESPPIFLGVTAVLLKWIKRSKLIFNVSDLWPESAIKLGLVRNNLAIKITTFIEEWIYKNSDKITGQTQGIINSISDRFPNKPYFWLRNGIDQKNIHDNNIAEIDWRFENKIEKNDFIVYYGGVIGYAQGLEVILKAANLSRDNTFIKYIVVGDGPEKEKLIKMKNDLGLNNVSFFPGVARAEVLKIINSIDVSVVPLKKLELFLGAIPSKIFEVLYFEKPILLGVDGEARKLFIEQANAGLYYEPENEKELSDKILELYNNRELKSVLGKNGKQYILKNFNREVIAKDFNDFINK